MYSHYKYPIDTSTLLWPSFRRLPTKLITAPMGMFVLFQPWWHNVFVVNNSDFRQPWHAEGRCPDSSTRSTCSACSTPIYYEIHCLESLGMVLCHCLRFPSLPCGSCRLPFFTHFILQSKRFWRIFRNAKGLSIRSHRDQWLFCALFCYLGYVFFF